MSGREISNYSNQGPIVLLFFILMIIMLAFAFTHQAPPATLDNPRSKSTEFACIHGHLYLDMHKQMAPVFEYREDLGFSVVRRCKE